MATTVEPVHVAFVSGRRSLRAVQRRSVGLEGRRADATDGESRRTLESRPARAGFPCAGDGVEPIDALLEALDGPPARDRR